MGSFIHICKDLNPVNFPLEPIAKEESLFNNGMFYSAVGKTNRVCHKGMRVRIYRNLNKPEYFSILAMEGVNKGKVCGYAKSIKLKSFKFKVSLKSRLRVLKDQRKNVHSFCEGYIEDAFTAQQPINQKSIEVSYNPYRGDAFYEVQTGSNVIDGTYNAIIQHSSVFISNYPVK